MINPSALKPESRLFLGYLATLLAVILCSGLALVVQYQHIMVEEKAASAMGVIAQQQIRVQEIALQARDLLAFHAPEEAEAMKKHLSDLANEMENSHNRLLDVFTDETSFFWHLADTAQLSASDLRQYRLLEQLIQPYLELSRQVARGEGTDQIRGQLEGLYQPILISLGDLQSSNAKRREAKVLSYKRFELAGFLMIIFVLILAGLAIFWPIARQIRLSRQDLEKAKTQAQRANRIKSEFIANISHEIRTPLTGITGFADLILKEQGLSSSVKEYTSSIRRSAGYLQTIINDVLDLSKVEAGAIEVRRDKVEIESLLQEVVSVVNLKLHGRQVRFVIHYETPIPKKVVTDPTRVMQVLINVLGNAIKFTEQGSVRVDVSTKEVGGGSKKEVLLVFKMTDTGCGISAKGQEKLFQRFSQVDGSLTRRAEGTGLGLALSRRLARLLGGDLVLLQSTPGQGSVFEFSVRCKLASKQRLETFNALRRVRKNADDEDVEGKLAGCRVLLVEDGQDNQRIYSQFLQLAGAEVVSCWDGLEGLEYASSRADFHLILMDIQLPGMDGATVTQELRRRGVSVPIIALTAHALEEEKRRCLQLGFTDYLSKPVGLGQLVASITEHLRHDTPDPVAAVAARQAVPTEEGDDTEEGRSRYHHKPIYQPMLVEFVGVLPERLKELEEARHIGDWQQFCTLSHRMKGAAATYGYPHLAAQASRLEVLSQQLQKNEKEHSSDLEQQAQAGLKELAEHLKKIAAAAAALPRP